jgi:hypothetical protein
MMEASGGTRQMRKLPAPLPALLGAFAGMLIGPAFLGQLTTLLPWFTPRQAVYCSGGNFATMLLLFQPMFLGGVIGAGLAWLHLPSRQAYRMPETLAGVCRYLTAPLLFLAVGTPLALLFAGASVCLGAAIVPNSAQGLKGPGGDWRAAVYDRAHSLAMHEVYDVSRTKSVRLYCTMSKKRAWQAGLVLEVGFGQAFTLVLNPRSRFSSQRIWEVLEDRPLDRRGIAPDCPQELRGLFPAEAGTLDPSFPRLP